MGHLISEAVSADVSDADAAPLLHEQLCFAIYSASHAMTRRYKPLLRKLDLTYPQYLCLLVLWQTDDQTVSAIGHRLHLDSGTLTPLLKRLEAAGLVRRVRDQSDERQVRILLTPKGQAMGQETAGFPEIIACAAGVSAETMGHLRDRLFELRDQMNKDGE